MNIHYSSSITRNKITKPLCPKHHQCHQCIYQHYDITTGTYECTYKPPIGLCPTCYAKHFPTDPNQDLHISHDKYHCHECNSIGYVIITEPPLPF